MKKNQVYRTNRADSGAKSIFAAELQSRTLATVFAITASLQTDRFNLLMI